MTCGSLQAEYGSGDVGTELLRESLVFEWCVPEEGSKHLQRLLSKQKPETEL
jgi:hypothetical protein